MHCGLRYRDYDLFGIDSVGGLIIGENEAVVVCIRRVKNGNVVIGS